MAGRKDKIQLEDKHRISKILWSLYCVFLIASAVIIVRIVGIQYFWEPDAETVSYFQPKRYESKTKPERGAILDMNGKLLAISTPMYNINMDCQVLKDDFKKQKSARFLLKMRTWDPEKISDLFKFTQPDKG